MKNKEIIEILHRIIYVSFETKKESNDLSIEFEICFSLNRELYWQLNHQLQNEIL